MSEIWQPEDDVLLSDSDDEDAELARIYNGHEALWFVVDANLAQQPERLLAALNIIQRALLSGLMVSSRDIMGVMFVNTAKCPPPLEAGCLERVVLPPSCAIFLPLHQLTKPIVEHYNQFMAAQPEQFEDDYGVAADDSQASFAAVIRVSIELIEKCGRKLNMGHIIYLTDRSAPHGNNTAELQWAMQKAVDLDKKFIEFHVIPMTDARFDYDKFFKEFISLSKGMDIECFEKPDEKLLREMLEDRKLKQDIMRRSLGHFKLALGPNLEIAVQHYNYFRRRIGPKKVLIMRKDNTIVNQRKSVVVRKVGDSSEPLLLQERQVKANEGWYEVDIGGQKIQVLTEQLNHVRNAHRPGMKLLGFKPKNALNELIYSRPSHFMYPDEESITGSRRLFRALWERCLVREKIAVCLFMPKRNSKPRYVALVPVEAVKLANETSKDVVNHRAQLCGDGFKIVYLPCAHHIRHIDWGSWNSIANTAEPEGVQLFRKIAKKLRISYQPALIDDPILSKLQAELMALALDIQTENDGITEMPDPEIQDERLEPLLPDYECLFGGKDDDLPAKGQKRQTADSEDASKRVKFTAPSAEALQSYDVVSGLIRENNLERCSVAMLKLILEKHFYTKLGKSAKKADLVEKIVELDTVRD